MTESQLVAPWGQEKKQGLTENRQEGLLQGDGNVLKLHCGDSCTTL